MLPFSPCSSLSHLHLHFCLPVNPSTFSGPRGGGAPRLFNRSLFPLPIQDQRESYRFEQVSCTSPDAICYLSPVFMCGMHSLWSSLKFLNSAKRFRWLTSIRDEEELWGEPVIKRLPLLMATHFNLQSSHPYPACQRFIYWKKEIKVTVFYSFFSVVFLLFPHCLATIHIFTSCHVERDTSWHVSECVCIHCKWGFYYTTNKKVVQHKKCWNSPSLLHTLYLKHECFWADAGSWIRPKALVNAH